MAESRKHSLTAEPVDTTVHFAPAELGSYNAEKQMAELIPAWIRENKKGGVGEKVIQEADYSAVRCILCGGQAS